MKSQVYLFSNRSDLLVPVSLSLELQKGPFDWFPLAWLQQTEPAAFKLRLLTEGSPQPTPPAV